MKEAAENAKIALSSSTTTEINLPYIMPVGGVPKHLVKTLSRAKFEALAHNLIEACKAPCQAALQGAGLSTSDIDEDEIMMQALEAGAEDVVPQDDVFEIYTNANDFSAVREELEKLGYGFLSAEVSMIPQTTVDASDPELAEKIERMIERFDDNDDVQQIYHNAILPEVEEEE